MLKRLKAFTIVEVLVVIAILGILIVLLIPAFHAARQAAQKKGKTSSPQLVEAEDQLPADAYNFVDESGTIEATSYSFPCPHCREPVKFLVIEE